MANYDGKTLVDAEVVIDDSSFVKATLRNCVLLYRGGGIPNFRDTHFQKSVFRFAGAALNALEMLAHIESSAPDIAKSLLDAGRKLFYATATKGPVN